MNSNKKVITGKKPKKAIGGPKGKRKINRRRFGPAPVGFGKGYLRGPSG